MDEKLDDALVRDFPILYQNRYKNCQCTCMCWGFECDSGWESLIRELSEKLENYNLKHKKNPVIAQQVKEKYGVLRFYFYGGDNNINNLIDEAENKSAEICEMCGKEGKLCIKNNYWYKTLCENCKIKLKYDDTKEK